MGPRSLLALTNLVLVVPLLAALLGELVDSGQALASDGTAVAEPQRGSNQ